MSPSPLGLGPAGVCSPRREAGLFLQMSPGPRETAAAAPSGPGWCLAVAALNPQDRGLKGSVQETKWGLSVRPSGPRPSGLLPFSSWVLGYFFVSIHEFPAPLGWQAAAWLGLWETALGRTDHGPPPARNCCEIKTPARRERDQEGKPRKRGKGPGSLVGLEQRKCGVPREQHPPGGAQPVVLTQHSWGQSPALQPPRGLPAESGLMRVHASEAGTTPSSWPHRKLPEDVRRTGATGTQTFWTRNPGWMSTLWNLHNGELIQAEWSTLRLKAGDADPPPQHPDPRPRALRFALKIQEPRELTLRGISLRRDSGRVDGDPAPLPSVETTPSLAPHSLPCRTKLWAPTGHPASAVALHPPCPHSHSLLLLHLGVTSQIHPLPLYPRPWV